MMTRDRIAFWRQIGDYAGVMEVFLDHGDTDKGIDFARVIADTEAEVWAMVDKYRKKESD